ncbi:MAG: hypothetical protein MAG794_00215 [Gammaproteobacteria bacterium]|nr:hypothetical protein [Gammaproteobacteria bacterium]
MLGALGLVGLLAVIDLVDDIGDGLWTLHVVTEVAVLVVVLVGAFVVMQHLIREAIMAREDAAVLAKSLEVSHREAKQWREEAQGLLQGLGQAIDRQFGTWSLTAAEKEVALFLLKGLSHKEIANIRGIGEATTRQQARSVYRKAGVSGRRDLAAFFLEDLALPSAAD